MGSSLIKVPCGVINHRESSVDMTEMFRECSSLAMDINDIFPDVFAEKCNLSYLFFQCSNVTGSKSEFMAKFPDPVSVANAFNYCSLLTD